MATSVWMAPMCPREPRTRNVECGSQHSPAAIVCSSHTAPRFLCSVSPPPLKVFSLLLSGPKASKGLQRGWMLWDGTGTARGDGNGMGHSDGQRAPQPHPTTCSAAPAGRTKGKNPKVWPKRSSHRNQKKHQLCNGEEGGKKRKKQPKKPHTTPKPSLPFQPPTKMRGG